MRIFIALLRGINVGGHHKVKMVDLKELFESVGLRKVKTYIQSGNVVFESDENVETLREQLEHEFSERFGFSSSMVLRTADEFEEIIMNCPYDFNALQEGESIHIAFLMEKPLADGVDHVRSFISESEECVFMNKEGYFLFREGVRNSKLAVQVQKLGEPVTMRNMKTVNKLAKMVGEMNE